MNTKKYQQSDYTPDKNTYSDIEKLYKQKENFSNFNLSHANLEKIYLVEADMKNADLSKANFKNTSMYGINLSGSNLFKTNFENANLNNANLENCNLLGANLSNTKLKNIYWGEDYKLINEISAEKADKEGNRQLAKEKYKEAEDIYRTIKISMQSQTLSEETGKFFIREMITKRKQFNKFSLSRIGSKIIEITTGYGEKLSNIASTVFAIIIVCMLLYGIEGIKYGDPVNGDRIIGFFTEDLEKFGILNTLGNLFYFSVVVYSTVGFGEMLPIGPLGKSIMIFEGIIGGLVLAILIIALYKKTMDR
ncbi:MAG: hypothetical protein CMG00_08570 [Candidatus Marinimicrobia bacterium]|nr:hypothetical protein [Candidatus Neomarinimicrobiota bacterium]